MRFKACDRCGEPVDTFHAAPKPGAPLLCLSCRDTTDGRDGIEAVEPGTPLAVHDGEAMDVIPTDERDVP